MTGAERFAAKWQQFQGEGVTPSQVERTLTDYRRKEKHGEHAVLFFLEDKSIAFIGFENDAEKGFVVPFQG